MGAEPKPCAYCGAEGVLSKSDEEWRMWPWHVAFDHKGKCPLRDWEGYTYGTKRAALRAWGACAGEKTEDEHGR